MGLLRLLFLVCLLAPALLLTACGGSGGSPSNPPALVLVSIVPGGNFQLDQGATQQFTANVSGTSNTAVNWSVQEGAAGGSITSTGLYTAPNAAGIFHVVAASKADSSKSATAAVTVPTVSVAAVNPGSVSMAPAENVAFTALVFGTVNKSVSWSISEGAVGGIITSSGSYTAPATPGTFHVVGTSNADNTKSAFATVTVALAVGVSISPSTDVLGPAGVRPFRFAITGTVNLSVVWSVQEGASGGSITQAGVYTAPNTTGTAHVVVTSVKDPTKSATATISLVASGFRPTGAMKDARSGHTATLLKNGKVLVAGGSNCFFGYYYYFSSCSLSAAELYDPASGTFASTGNMSTRRSFQTATLLPNGRALVAGGFNGGASAELYDPATGTFTDTGSMMVGRASHTATLLSNGKVLIAGGVGVSSALATAELYDPATGTFSTTGSMASPRSGHSATLLSNGKVIIAGGDSGSGTLGSAELYDPVSGTFAATGSLTNARRNHAAALLANGNVLLVGGSGSPNSPLATAEIYDVSNRSFAATGSMTVARATPIAMLLPNAMVLITGGTSVTAELFNLATASFAQTGSPQIDHQDGAAVLMADGQVLLTGGAGANDQIDSNMAELYK
jgi:hypothetical protein